MEKPLNNINQEEALVKNLFRGYEPQRAPEGLTKKIMQQVMAEWVIRPKPMRNVFWDENRVWIVLGALGLCALAFWIDLQWAREYMQTIGLSFQNHHLQNLQRNVDRALAWGRSIPSVLVYTSVALVTLLAIDAAYGKLKRT